MIVLTWERLLEIAPELAEWEADARSIARNAKADFYTAWLPSFAPFRSAIDAAVRRHRLDRAAAFRVAVDHLTEVYRVQRGRALRKRRTAA